MPDVPLFILYGSATGNAESIAKDLADKYKHEIPSPFNKILCLEANDFKKKCLPIWTLNPPQNLAQKYGLVFVTSTTGNGESPENGSRFIRYLKRKTTIEANPLKHVAYGVLGLGDTNYDKFCESGIVADKKLLECGGERVKKLGTADEGTGLEEVVDDWVEDIVPLLAKACKLSTKTQHEEKKSEDISTQAQPGSRPSISINRGLPNVQAILNSRLGVSVGNAGSSVSKPCFPSNGFKPNVSIVGSKPPVCSQPKSLVIGPANIKKELKSPSPLFILYGSATGNAEEIAKTLCNQYKEMISSEENECYFPEVICCELDQYKKKCLKVWEDGSELDAKSHQKHGVLVITSTTGNGDAPENASRFTRYIKRKTTIEAMPFKNVAYAVLGLGDTNYDQFCETGKVIDKKMKDLGGTRVNDITCADEGTGLEQEVDPWVKNIFTVIREGCQGMGLSESKNATFIKEEEEKKSAHLPTLPVDTAVHARVENKQDSDVKCVMSETGVSVIQKMIGDSIIPEVDVAMLPSLGTSLSSCQLLEDHEMLERKSSRGLSLSEMEKLTVSSASSSNINYTHDNPFESTIVGARYLTKTDLRGVRLACDALSLNKSVRSTSREDDIILAMKQLHDAFPLGSNESPDYEKNGKRVIEMKLSLPEDFTLEYQPGDSVGIVVSNSAFATKFVLDILFKHHGISSTQKISVDEKNPITVDTAIRDRVDLCSPIKNKRILIALSQFASDKSEANALKLLSSKDPIGQDLFSRYIDSQRMTVLDILTLFPSCQSITLEGLLSTLPGIASRYYSISSSPLGQNLASLQLTVAFSVVDYITPCLFLPDRTALRRRTGGLATRYLEAMCAPYLLGARGDIGTKFSLDRIKIFPKPTADFRLPASLTVPMILIGPGTGVAPFIGFLKHREVQLGAMDSTKVAKVVSEGTWRGGFNIEEEDLCISKKDAKGLIMGADYRSDQRIGDIALYYGCRRKDHDWLYKSEMESLDNSGIISLLRVAFSRDNKGTKCYVQDKLREDAKSISRMVMEENASIFICGDGNAMAKDVQNCLVDVFADYFMKRESSSGEEATEKAKKYLDTLKLKNKVLLDIWS